MEQRFKFRSNLLITISGIAISGTLGIGLFMRTGVMITLCGAGGTVIAYCIAGFIITCVMLCLSEMVSFKHSPGVIFDFPSMFVSPALGFTVGIIYWSVGIVHEYMDAP